MNNIRKTIEILFKRKNPESVIQNFYSPSFEKKDNYCSWDEFEAFFRTENKSLYNKNEIENIYKMYSKKTEEKNSFFDVLLDFTEEVLKDERGTPICRYEHLFRWRELSFLVEEDLLTTSFFAYKDFRFLKDRYYFSWEPVIKNDNYRLNQILKRGMAENHFHLKGSAPHFNISWISLMNNISDRKKEFKRLTKAKRLNPRIDIEFSKEEYNLELLVKKAAIIRYFFYSILKSEDNNFEKIEKKLNLKEILNSDSLEIFKIYEDRIVFEINAEKYISGKCFGGEVPDYFITKETHNINFLEKSANILLFGERKFLYEIFKRIYSKDINIIRYEELFYAYILIKEQFRDEMIQINDAIGFGNFADYQGRKGYFIKKNSLYEKAVINSAVNSSLLNQSIQSLEARIAPEKSMKELVEEIKKIDKIVRSDIFSLSGEDQLLKIVVQEREEKKEKKEYFYTIHFIKEMEKKIEVLKDLNISHRNKTTREKILKETLEIEKLRKSSQQIKYRIYGIDAANVEIGCRPEVFSIVYRYLKELDADQELLLCNDDVIPLGRSFHVGEEFMDLADGLRAIDECIKFLNFSQGDRLGHALALGIDPLKYYRSKDMILIMEKQDILDNTVWLLGQIVEKGIECKSSLTYKLESLYRKYFYEIYEKNNDELKNCSYRDYYDSWKLRGDCPELYFDISDQLYEKIGITILDDIKLNKSDEANIARKSVHARNIYREYHFNGKSRTVGKEIDELKIDYDYIDLVRKIQQKMQIEIARKNICIETNPSSNYLIGTFDKYNEHPITKFFNLGLTADTEKIGECPQISVSINTDDQGVFGTNLENEYALIALSLEKERDNKGNYIYNQSMIYDWIDRVRQMGLEQSFYLQKNNKL